MSSSLGRRCVAVRPRRVLPEAAARRKWAAGGREILLAQPKQPATPPKKSSWENWSPSEPSCSICSTG